VSSTGCKGRIRLVRVTTGMSVEIDFSYYIPSIVILYSIFSFVHTIKLCCSIIILCCAHLLKSK